MSSKFDISNYFLNPEINLPAKASCSKLFNKIFQDGLSFTSFENHVKSKAVSQDLVPHVQFNSVIQYNLDKDIWGVKELIMIAKGGFKDADVVITYGIRDANEWTHLVSFFEENWNAIELENKPGHRVYQYRIYLEPNDTRQIFFHVLRDTPQSSKMTLMLKF